MEFRRIKIEDQEKYNNIIKEFKFNTCDYCFTDLYIWQHFYNFLIAFDEDNLYIQVTIRNQEKMYYPPIGKNIKKGIEKLIECSRENDEKLVLTCIEDFQRELIQEKFPSQFIYKEIRSNADYVYLTEDLMNLKGKKYKNKRNFVNGFEKLYKGQYEYQDIKNVSRKEIISFLDEWFLQNETENKKAYQEEKVGILILVDNMEELNAIGGVIKINQRIVALTMGSIFNEMVITHFEKALSSIHGSYQMINYLFANHTCSKYKYINREEDLGFEGLRQAKMTYHPVFLARNYNAYFALDFPIEMRLAKADEEKEVQDLFNTAFKEDAFNAYFFKYLFKLENNYVVTHENQIVCSLIRMIYFLSDGSKVAYYYGLVTKESYRKNGLMTTFIRKINEMDQQEGIHNSFLLLENKNLLSFYNKAGYQTFYHTYYSVYFFQTIYDIQLKAATVLDAAMMQRLYDGMPVLHLARSKDKFIELMHLTNQFGRTYVYYRENELLGYAFVYEQPLIIKEIIAVDEEVKKQIIQKIMEENHCKKITVYGPNEASPIIACCKEAIQFYAAMMWD